MSDGFNTLISILKNYCYWGTGVVVMERLIRENYMGEVKVELSRVRD